LTMVLVFLSGFDARLSDKRVSSVLSSCVPGLSWHRIASASLSIPFHDALPSEDDTATRSTTTPIPLSADGELSGAGFADVPSSPLASFLVSAASQAGLRAVPEALSDDPIPSNSPPSQSHDDDSSPKDCKNGSEASPMSNACPMNVSEAVELLRKEFAASNGALDAQDARRAREALGFAGPSSAAVSAALRLDPKPDSMDDVVYEDVRNFRLAQARHEVSEDEKWRREIRKAADAFRRERDAQKTERDAKRSKARAQQGATGEDAAEDILGVEKTNSQGRSQGNKAEAQNDIEKDFPKEDKKEVKSEVAEGVEKGKMDDSKDESANEAKDNKENEEEMEEERRKVVCGQMEKYLGEPEPKLVQHLLDLLRKGVEREDLVKEVRSILEEDAEDCIDELLQMLQS